MYLEDSVELTHRYGGTYLGLRENGIIIPFYVNSFSGAGKEMRTLDGAKYINNGTNVVSELEARKVREEEVVWPGPLLGFINTNDKSAKFVYRRPEERGHGKQRGLLPACTFYWYYSNEGRFYESSLAELLGFPDRADLCSIYNPKYLSPEEAWQRVRGGEYRGAAISKTIAMFKTRLHKQPLVFYKTSVAGIYNKKTNTVHLRPKAHMLYEEISMYAKCEKSGIPVEEVPVEAHFVAPPAAVAEPDIVGEDHVAQDW